jgi:hypothetical protein
MVSTELVICTLNARGASTVAFLAVFLIFFNGHLGVAKPNQLGFVPLFGYDSELFGTVRGTNRFIIL